MPDEDIDRDYSGDSALDDVWAREATGKYGADSPGLSPEFRKDFGKGVGIGIADGDSGTGFRSAINRRRAAAQDKAKKSEAAASAKKGAGDKSGVSAAKDAEQAGSEKDDNFVNKVAGKAVAKSAPGGQVIADKLKKMGPFGTILLAICAIMAIFSSSQAMAPFGMVANGLDQFNALRTAMNRQDRAFKVRMLSRKGKNSKYLRTSVYSGETEFRIKDSLSAKLSKNNVHYLELGDVNILVYTDPDTKKTFGVAADDVDIGKIPNSVEIDGKQVEIDTKTEIFKALDMSDNFETSMDRSTRTLKGHIAGWFDNLSEALHLKRLKSSRNRFKNTGSEATDAEIVDAARKGGLDEEISSSKPPDNDDETKQKRWVEGDEDHPGHWVEENVDGTDNEGLKKGTTDRAVIENSVTKRVNAAIASLGDAAGKYCGVVKAISAVGMIVSAIHLANVINYITGFLEAIQKVQAGDSSGAELNYYMKGLTTKGTTTDVMGNVIEGKEDTAAVESPAWNQFFSDGKMTVSPTDKAAEKFNKDYIFSSSVRRAVYDNGGSSVADEAAQFFTTAGSSLSAYKTCVMAQQTAATAQVTVDVVMVVASIFTFGAAAIADQIVDEVGQMVTDFVLSAVVGAVVSSLMSVTFPFIAQWLAMDLIGNMAGEDAAYAINSGFNAYLGKQMQQSSGLVGDEEQVMRQYRETQAVIAEESEYERKTHSPFDITNKYTFLGSIVNSVTPLATAISASPIGIVSNTMSLVGSSAKSLLPTAAAAGETNFRTSLNKNCPSLSELSEEIGRTLVADAFCYPYFVSDYSTIGMDPADVFDKVYELDHRNFDLSSATEQNNYNPKINANSSMGKWTLACTQRESQFGTADPNIMNAIASIINTGNGTIDAVIDSGVSSIPYIGSAWEMAEATKETANMGWTSGASCFSKEASYYSRYSENQRYMESAGIIDESAVSAFLREYYEENPLDTSFEGTIARYAGMAKETVADVMTVMEYIAYLDEYDPDSAGPMLWGETKEYAYEDGNIVPDHNPEAIVGKHIIYQDLRAVSIA